MSVTERTRIEPRGGAIAYTEDEGKTWVELSGDAIVSMNLWGFTPSFVEAGPAGLCGVSGAPACRSNPLKCEYYLPSVVSAALAAGRARGQGADQPGQMVRHHLPGGQARPDGGAGGHDPGGHLPAGPVGVILQQNKISPLPLW